MDSWPETQQYTVFLNPYADQHFLQCPRCRKKTHERNRVLVVELASGVVVPAMAACRYCANCDLLIAHQAELVATLREVLPEEEQSSVEGPMFAIGVLDRTRLKRGELHELTPVEARAAFRPIEDQVHFELIRDEAGGVEYREEAVAHRLDPSEIPVPDLADVQALPQVAETWQLATVRLWTWITGEEEKPYRPLMTLLVSPAGPFLVFQEMTRTPPSLGAIRDTLLKAMSSPAIGAGEPRRPSAVMTSSEEFGRDLALLLAPLDIRVVAGEMPELDEVVGEVESYLAGDHEPPPGLLDDPRVTPEQVGELFQAAAQFYREAPWECMLDEDLIAVCYPLSDGDWRFASVMGHGGMEFGLAVFENLFDYDQLAFTPPEAFVGMMDYRSLTFDDEMTVPFADLDAIEYYGWEVAAEDAFPIPLIFTTAEEVERPGPEEIEWYTVALRAVVAFFRRVWPDDPEYVPEPVSTVLTVPLAGRRVRVALRYPADLVLEEE